MGFQLSQHTNTDSSKATGRNYLEVNLASFQKKTPLKFSSLYLRQHNKVICLQQHVHKFNHVYI